MIKRVKIDRNGLEMFVGSLECAILLTLWDMCKGTKFVTTAQLYYVLINDKIGTWSYPTVITTLNRMADKSLLIRQKIPGTVTRWAPTATDEDQFIQMCVNAAIHKLFEEYPIHSYNAIRSE